MEWSGLIRINKIIKLDKNYAIYADLINSSESFTKLSDSYSKQNNEAIMIVKLYPLMFCNCYDKFKIKTTKKFNEIDFSNSNVYIKLEMTDDKLINVKTLTKTEKTLIKTEIINKKNYKTNGKKKFSSELIDICKKINN